MKLTRTTCLIFGRPDAAPWLCLMIPVAVAAIFHEFLVLPRGLRLELPAADSPVVAAPGERFFIVAADVSGRLYFENQIIGLTEMQALLTARSSQSNAPRTLLIQADQAVSAARLSELSTTARSAGVRDVILLTRPLRP